MSDTYGTDIAITPAGDLAVAPSGALGAAQGAQNCVQALTLRLRTSEGELPLHPFYGSVLPGLVGSKLNAGAIAAQLNGDLRTLLADDTRFTTAQAVSYQAPATAGVPGSILIGVQATLRAGEQLSLADASDPSAIDVTLAGPVDPAVDPTLVFDPTLAAEFYADDAELDTLADLNTVQSMVNDLPGA